MFGWSTTARSDRSRSRRARRAAVAVTPLEGRSLLSTLTITESVSPRVLWPPNGRRVPVTVSGTVTDRGATLNPVQFNVHNSETGTTTHNRLVTLNGNGQYSFIVDLQARRSGRDKAGRLYTINILASDSHGASGTDSAFVIVPHDQGHPVLVPAGPFITTINSPPVAPPTSPSPSTTVTSPPVSPPASPSPSSPVIISNPGNSGKHGNQGDQGDRGDQGDQGDQGDEGGGRGNGHGHGNDNGNGNGHKKAGGD